MACRLLCSQFALWRNLWGAPGADLPSGSCGTVKSKAGATERRSSEVKKGLIAIGTDKGGKPKRINWHKIRAEYIAGGISQRQLAKDYKIPFSTLQKRAQREEWGKNRRDAMVIVAENAVQKTAEVVADNATLAAGIKRKLLERLDRMLDSFPEDEATEVQKFSRQERKVYKLKDLTAMYKDLTADMAQPDEQGNALLESLLELERRSGRD